MLRQALVFLLIILSSSGCALIPPKRIPVDRQEYLEAINTSWKEELLSNLVRLHHGDSSTFLELTGVNTAYNLGGSAQAGYTGNMNFTSKPSGNDLIWSPSTGAIGPTGSASISYARTPSVTYVPTRGENLGKMLDPIPQDTVMKILQAYNFAPYILPVIAESITIEAKHEDKNKNKDKDKDKVNKTYHNNYVGFDNFVRGFIELYQQGIINIDSERMKVDNVAEKIEEATVVDTPQTEVRTNTSTKKKASTPPPNKTTTKSVIKYVTEYYLTPSEKPGDLERFKNLLPVKLKDCAKVGFSIQTRSIMQMLVLLSKSVHWEESATNKNEFRIIESKVRPPGDVFVRLKYRDHWYYILEGDESSKKVFSLMVSILGMSESSSK